MIKQLTASIRGATHVEVSEVVLSIAGQAITVRGTLGSMVSGAFVADTALRRVEHTFTGQTAVTLAQGMGLNGLWSALNESNWGF